MLKNIPVQISEEDYKKLVFEKLKNNHIWLNKMAYLSPTILQKIQLADMILEKLQNQSTQIPPDNITSDNEGMRELAQLTPILYLRINWS